MVLLGLVLAALCQLLQLVDPLITRTIVDDYVIPHARYEAGPFLRGVGRLLLLTLSFAIAARLTRALQDYCVTSLAQRVGSAIYCDGIQHTLQLSYARFEDQRSGETLGRLHKVRTDVENLVRTAISRVFTVLITVVFVTAYIVTIHWTIVAILAVAVPMLGLLSSVLTRRVKKVQRVIVAEMAGLAGSATETLRNVEIVKSLGLVDQEIARLVAGCASLVRLELRKARASRAIDFVHGTSVVSVRVLITFVMVYLIHRGTLTVGQWLSLWLFWAYIFGPMQDLGPVISTFRETEASLESFKDLLSVPVETTPANPVPIGRLDRVVFDDVTFSYAAVATPVLAHVSCSIERGRSVAFVGPSGSGKTTLVKLLVGLYGPEHGRVLYNDVPGATVDLAELRAQIGLVTQDTHLFAGTIRQNLLFVQPGASDAECLSVLRQAACDDLLARSGRGLDTVIGEGGIKLSGGEKQRVSIARALLRRPNLLVFDEATSSLDSLTEEEVTATVRAVASSGLMTALIAHRLSTVRHADTIHVLERGRIVESGRHADLLERKGLYYAMWRQQVGDRPEVEDPLRAATSPLTALSS